MIAYQLKYLEENQIKLEDVMYYEPLLSNFMEVMQIMFVLKIFVFIWDALRDLVPFVQFRNIKKRPWGSVTATLLKVSLLHVCLLNFAKMVPKHAKRLI